VSEKSRNHFSSARVTPRRKDSNGESGELHAIATVTTEVPRSHHTTERVGLAEMKLILKSKNDLQLVLACPCLSPHRVHFTLRVRLRNAETCSGIHGSEERLAIIGLVKRQTLNDRHAAQGGLSSNRGVIVPLHMLFHEFDLVSPLQHRWLS
jgi:hypothetical protein